jgi:hypothetical protein
MRARALPLETQISLAPVLSDFAATDKFKKLLVSITKSIRTWTLGFAIAALFAGACATPVGVTRLDEQAAHRELTANVLSTGNRASIRPNCSSARRLASVSIKIRKESLPS